MPQIRARTFIVYKLVFTLLLQVWTWVLIAAGAGTHGPAWVRANLGIYLLVIWGGLTFRMVALGAELRLVRRLERDQKILGQLPERLDWMGEDADGNHVVTIVRQNGEMAQITVPENYDPRSDGGRLLVELAAPEAAAFVGVHFPGMVFFDPDAPE